MNTKTMIGGPDEIEMAPNALVMFATHADDGHMVPGCYAAYLKRALEQAVKLGGFTIGIEPIRPTESRCAVYGGEGDNRWFDDCSVALYDCMEAFGLPKPGP